MSILKRFVDKCLEDITYPNKPHSWHVEGRLKNKSNQIFKFDVRGMSKVQEKKLEKTGNTNPGLKLSFCSIVPHYICFLAF